ncbi:MAG: gamma-glutamyl-gamma-aminobutyrate hydrolase family protein, partial [Oscillospiraceae bacterium]|nr:gamma-glutamyl-gamma-aminobutyrate hydrolase family protein [Oscillospiraceae bacterium]
MEQKKPLVGITCNYDPRDLVGISSQHGAVGQDWNFVTGDYVYALEKAGATPVLLPRCNDSETLLPILEMLDGILITGGTDVAPYY